MYWLHRPLKVWWASQWWISLRASAGHAVIVHRHPSVVRSGSAGWLSLTPSSATPGCRRPHGDLAINAHAGMAKAQRGAATALGGNASLCGQARAVAVRQRRDVQGPREVVLRCLGRMRAHVPLLLSCRGGWFASAVDLGGPRRRRPRRGVAARHGGGLCMRDLRKLLCSRGSFATTQETFANLS